MQLKLLKMESGANADGLMLTPSDKDIGQDLSRSPRIMKYLMMRVGNLSI